MRVAVLPLVFLSVRSFAAPPAAASTPTAGSLLQVFLALLLVLAAIAACAWVLKRMTPGGMQGGAGMKVIGGVMVGPKERVVVVELADTWLVLGVTANQVNTLHTLPRPEHAESLQGANGEAPFARWLSQAMQKIPARNTTQQEQ
ncbi:flagellar protein FliO/FliZ [Chitinivorax tropicus]|uniref:Flagellar protein n=1 Tax=Chitinivorax tropicus TaxID=714531 RepID=A0A840MUH5_9PROT|nr:flagellar biosynthetic protein FliO [Chitinivorax tropicus]MBB5020452.1 flagellar protein FliO/FliZ [Chitinivorax tropicus]